MKPREPNKNGQHDMFRSLLDQILRLSHEKVILADQIDWRFLSEQMGVVYTDGPGQKRRVTPAIKRQVKRCSAVNGQFKLPLKAYSSQPTNYTSFALETFFFESTQGPV